MTGAAKKRVIVVSSKPNVAMVKYCRNFADPVKPHGRTEFSAAAAPYIRTKLKIMDRIKKTLHKTTDDILMQTMASDGIFEVRDRKVITNAKVRVKERSMPFTVPAPKTFADQVQEVMSAVSNVENKYIQNVIVKKNGIDINLFTKSMIKYMQNACISSSSKAVISVDKTYNLCGTFVTITTFKFSSVIRRKTGENPLLIGPIMLHSNSDFDTYFGFFSTVRRILKLYVAGLHAKVFVRSDDEKAIAKAALHAIR